LQDETRREAMLVGDAIAFQLGPAGTRLDIPLSEIEHITRNVVLAPAKLRRQFEALLTQLGDDDYRTRREATEKIVRLGGEARGLVQQAIETEKDLETRLRLRQALARLAETPAGEQPGDEETSERPGASPTGDTPRKPDKPRFRIRLPFLK
jgi:hypothetical protein